MRVLVVTDWPALEAGTERYVDLLVDTLRAQGDEVALMTSSAGNARDGTADYVAYGTHRRRAQAAVQLVNPSAVATLRRALADFRPDGVHLNMFLPHLSPAILGALGDVRTMMMICDFKPVCPKGTKLRSDGSQCRARAGSVCWRGGCLSLPRYMRDSVRYRIFGTGLANVDRVGTLSAAMQNELLQVGIAADVLPLPVPSAHGFVHKPAADPMFVYGGRLAPVKGVDILLRAFAAVAERRPDARLRVFGDGPDRDKLFALAQSLGLGGAVTFRFGMQPNWTDGLEDAWALVVPSVYREPLGLVAVEAIVRGVPVVATAGGGLGETVEHGVSGLLVPNGDQDALAAALIDVAEGRSLPGRSVPPAAVEAIRSRHDAEAHARAVRAVFTEGAPAVAA